MVCHGLLGALNIISVMFFFFFFCSDLPPTRTARLSHLHHSSHFTLPWFTNRVWASYKQSLGFFIHLEYLSLEEKRAYT